MTMSEFSRTHAIKREVCNRALEGRKTNGSMEIGGLDMSLYAVVFYALASFMIPRLQTLFLVHTNGVSTHCCMTFVTPGRAICLYCTFCTYLGLF